MLAIQTEYVHILGKLNLIYRVVLLAYDFLLFS